MAIFLRKKKTFTQHKMINDRQQLINKFQRSIRIKPRNYLVAFRLYQPQISENKCNMNIK